MALRNIRRDWTIGEDPGLNCFSLCGTDGNPIDATVVTDAQCEVYDLTLNPSAILTTLSLVVASVVQDAATYHAFATSQLGALWTSDDIGFNVRHYLKDSVFSGATALVAGHKYKFVYKFTTPAFNDAAANSYGALVAIREGTCRQKN